MPITHMPPTNQNCHDSTITTTTTTDAHHKSLNFRSGFVAPPLQPQLLPTSTSLNVPNNIFSITPLCPARSSLWQFSYMDRVRERWSGVSEKDRGSRTTRSNSLVHTGNNKKHIKQQHLDST